MKNVALHAILAQAYRECAASRRDWARRRTSARPVARPLADARGRGRTPCCCDETRREPRLQAAISADVLPAEDHTVTSAGREPPCRRRARRQSRSATRTSAHPAVPSFRAARAASHRRAAGRDHRRAHRRSPHGNINASRSCFTTSRKPRMSEQTTGVSHAIDSSSVIPNDAFVVGHAYIELCA